ncbi:transposase [Aerosakkonemataceae cyanobacterium BLCC-F50]|uniref:Transposase n=1 Tax=Floridaenema flaviceps BLCC-F50 TaxID=3153642 RepID=A0ABV4XRJ7_9CYAN
MVKLHSVRNKVYSYMLFLPCFDHRLNFCWLGTTRRHLSRRRFEKALGVSPTTEASGDKSKKKIVGGSDLCRKALWQWLFTRISPEKCRLKNAIGKKLGAALDKEKSLR